MPEVFTTQDPTNASWGKPLEEIKWDKDVGGFVKTTNREVPHGTVPSTPVATEIDLQVLNQTNTQKSRLVSTKILPGAAGSQVKETTAPTQELSRFACETSTVTSFGDGSLQPTESFLNIGSSMQELNTNNRVVKNTSVSAFGDRVTWQTDEEGNRIKVTESVVNVATPIPANTAGTEYDWRQISCVHAILTKKEFPDFAAYTKTFYDTQQIAHPTLVFEDDVAYTTFFNTQTGMENMAIDLNARHGFTCATVVKTVVTLSASDDPGGLEGAVPSTPVKSWRTADLYYDGVFFKLQLANVLHDVAYFFFAVGSDNESYTPGDEERYYPTPSTPSSTDYALLVAANDWILIDENSSQWKYGLTMRTRKYIRPL